MKGIKIKGFSNYWIFPELGKVWSIKSNKWVGSKSPNGYYHLALCGDDGNIWHTSVHRVIWTSVNGEIPESMVINHKSERKDENFIWNLEVCSIAYNNAYGTRTERAAESLKGVHINRKDMSKSVGVYDMGGKLEQVFPSASEAARYVGGDPSSITKCCRGVKHYRTHKGRQYGYV